MLATLALFLGVLVGLLSTTCAEEVGTITQCTTLNVVSFQISRHEELHEVVKSIFLEAAEQQCAPEVSLKFSGTLL